MTACGIYTWRVMNDRTLAKNGAVHAPPRAASGFDGPLTAALARTATDHVAPRRSVDKIVELTAAGITFVLSSGRHNVDAPMLGAPTAGYAPLGDAPGSYVFDR